MSSDYIFEEIPGLYKIIKLNKLRRTPGVYFDYVPMDFLPRIDAIDRVIHEGGAVSPGAVGNIERPWYMHHYQDDNLIVLDGIRYIDIYSHEHGKVESFVVTPHSIHRNGELVFEGASMLVWPKGVFHRITSDKESGSASLNLAVHYEGFNIKNNFSIYELNTESGAHNVIREGHRDQETD